MCGAFKSCSGCFVTSKLNCDSLVLKGIPIKCKSENCLSLNKITSGRFCANPVEKKKKKP